MRCSKAKSFWSGSVTPATVTYNILILGSKYGSSAESVGSSGRGSTLYRVSALIPDGAWSRLSSQVRDGFKLGRTSWSSLSETSSHEVVQHLQASVNTGLSATASGGFGVDRALETPISLFKRSMDNSVASLHPLNQPPACTPANPAAAP